MKLRKVLEEEMLKILQKKDRNNFERKSQTGDNIEQKLRKIRKVQTQKESKLKIQHRIKKT